MRSSIPTAISLPGVGGVVRDQSDEEHEERAQDRWDPGCYEGWVVAPDLVIDQSGHWHSWHANATPDIFSVVYHNIQC